MNEKTKQYVQFIKENHKAYGGAMNGAECAKELNISAGRISQLLTQIELMNSEPRVTTEPANQEVQVGPVETAAA